MFCSSFSYYSFFDDGSGYAVYYAKAMRYDDNASFRRARAFGIFAVSE